MWKQGAIILGKSTGQEYHDYCTSPQTFWEMR